MQYFEYGNEEIEYLKKKDKAMAKAIDRIGIIKRLVIPDLFSGLVSSIVGQQISMKAADTIWNRFVDRLKVITPESLNNLSIEEIQSLGISMRKAGYIKHIAEAVFRGNFSIEDLYNLPDDEVCRILSSLPGIGVWTAEMLMIFSMNRKNILSWGDLAIKRGMMKLYHHKEITKERFEKYRKRYSPYGTIASLYLWEISKD